MQSVERIHTDVAGSSLYSWMLLAAWWSTAHFLCGFPLYCQGEVAPHWVEGVRTNRPVKFCVHGAAPRSCPAGVPTTGDSHPPSPNKLVPGHYLRCPERAGRGKNEGSGRGKPPSGSDLGVYTTPFRVVGRIDHRFDRPMARCP